MRLLLGVLVLVTRAQAQTGDGLLGALPLRDFARFLGFVRDESVGFQELVSVQKAQQPLPQASVNSECPFQCHFKGKCIRGKCQCFNGYTGEFCEQVHPWCPNNCLGHGICDSVTLKCSCFAGFSGDDCSAVVSICENDCSGRGSCNPTTGTCSCFSGFSGSDCSLATMNACPLQCSTHGVCKQGVCECARGFKGIGCEKVKFGDGCENHCSAHGSCVNGVCVCHVGFRGVTCSEAQAFPASGAYGCPSSCSGRGICVGGTCICAFGWFGDRCSQSFECVSTCSGHGACGPDNSCACARGFGGSHCELVVGGDCPQNCNGLGECKLDFVWGFLGETSVCRCEPPARGLACEVTDGSGRRCPKGCSGNGFCNDGVCECNGEFEGPACDRPIFSCPRNCTGNGVCLFGKCSCVRGFTGADCSVPVKTCPHDCSFHGACDCGICRCDPEWGGIDCSRTCAASCSGHGTCVHGSCACEPNWLGEICEVDSSCPNGCNQQGQCIDGVCMCDLGWTGDDCSFEGNDNDYTPRCDKEPFNNCSSHGVCSFDSIARESKCVCDSPYKGIDCSSTDAGHYQCESEGALKCVSSWVQQGCPWPVFVSGLPSSCAQYAKCFVAKEHSECPFGPHLDPSSRPDCGSANATLCAARWVNNGCTGVVAPRCYQYFKCFEGPRLCNQAIDCYHETARECVQIWVDSGCPHNGVNNTIPSECARWMPCTIQAVHDGLCEH